MNSKAATLVWATPDMDKHLAYIARVSNPDNQDNPQVEKLFSYMMKEGHTSPFEMANACIEINTTRDIARQILRHRSFSFQEFSQRYQSVTVLSTSTTRECRLQDTKNRQNSLNTATDTLKILWDDVQWEHIKRSYTLYQWALDSGIAKEQARVLLPEGLTNSKMYMNGTMRSWIFYLKARLHESTQKEHRDVAQVIHDILFDVAPKTMQAFFPKACSINTEHVYKNTSAL